MNEDNLKARTSEDAAGSVKRGDRFGYTGLLGNICSGWLATFLQIISGFILPRLINDGLGQGSLGVWDFGWAVVSYFILLQGGIVSSVNRYVAKHYGNGDIAGLNRALSSVGLVLKGVAILIAILACLVAWFVPVLLEARLGGLASEAVWVVLLLGFTIAIQVQGAIYGGLLTGLHRWTIQNGIKTIAAVFSIVGCLLAIALGGSIAWLAGVMMLSEILARSAQRIMARQVFPEMDISIANFSKSVALDMSKFGGKGYLIVISQLLVNQTASILVVASMGVGALAVFARPRNLVRAFGMLVQRSALVIVPMVGSLQSAGEFAELRRLAITGSRYAVFACLPAIAFLLTFGSDVMQIWMGDGYGNALLIGIFAIAGLTEAMSVPLFRLLMGMDCHGRIAAMNLASAVVTAVAAGIGVFVFHAGQIWIAIAIAVPSVLVNAVFLPCYASRILDIKPLELVSGALMLPILCSLPGVVFMVVATTVLTELSSIERVVIGATGAGLCSGWFYWRHAIPAQMKNRAAELIRFGRGRISNPAA